MSGPDLGFESDFPCEIKSGLTRIGLNYGLNPGSSVLSLIIADKQQQRDENTVWHRKWRDIYGKTKPKVPMKVFVSEKKSREEVLRTQ